MIIIPKHNLFAKIWSGNLEKKIIISKTTKTLYLVIYTHFLLYSFNSYDT